MKKTYWISYPLIFCAGWLLGWGGAPKWSEWFPPVVAQIGSNNLTLADLDRDTDVINIKKKTQQELHDARMAALDGHFEAMIVSYEAEQQDLSVEAYERQEILTLLKSADDQTLIEWLGLDTSEEENKTDSEFLSHTTQMVRDVALTTEHDSEATQAFNERLRQHVWQQARQQLMASLKQRHANHHYLTPPRIPLGERVLIHDGKASAKGPEKALITLVEYSDFVCGYCRSSQTTLHELAEKFGNDIRWVYRFLPLDDAPDSLNYHLAEAAQCAAVQGKFWQFHDALYDATDPETLDLMGLSDQLGLERQEFETCLNTHQSRDQIDADIQEAKRLNIKATPAFFINGVSLPGEADADEMIPIIEQEIADQHQANTGKQISSWFVSHYRAVSSAIMRAIHGKTRSS